MYVTVAHYSLDHLGDTGRTRGVCCYIQITVSTLSCLLLDDAVTSLGPVYNIHLIT